MHSIFGVFQGWYGLVSRFIIFTYSAIYNAFCTNSKAYFEEFVEENDCQLNVYLWLLTWERERGSRLVKSELKSLNFRIEFLLGPCAILALVLNHEFSVMEILWTFSIYLESVAILPQLFMVSKTGEAESITSHYLFALGSYRGLYILNWIYRLVKLQEVRVVMYTVYPPRGKQ